VGATFYSLDVAAQARKKVAIAKQLMPVAHCCILILRLKIRTHQQWKKMWIWFSLPLGSPLSLLI